MPGADDAGPSSIDLELELPGSSRRSLLKGVAAASAAGIAAAALAGRALPAAASSRAAAGPAGGAGTPPASEAVVVHVRDAATGEMDVFQGTTSRRVRDPELAARLVRAGG